MGLPDSSDDDYDVIHNADAISVSDFSDGLPEEEKCIVYRNKLTPVVLGKSHEDLQSPQPCAQDLATPHVIQKLSEQLLKDIRRGQGSAEGEQGGNLVNDGLKSTKPMSQKSTSKDDALIAVIGMTGSGKTTFISKVTGRTDLQIRNGLTSCTHDIQVIETSLDGQTLRLLDTPGFSDTNLPDMENLTQTEVLQMIDHYLAAHRMKLTGIIYLHSVADTRAAHHTASNIDMLRALTGADSLQRVTLATTMWGPVGWSDGVRRERELRRTSWARMLAMGAATARVTPVPGSAHAVVRRFQQEEIRDTAELASLKEEHRRELAEVHEALQGYYQGRVGELERALADERRHNVGAVLALNGRIAALEKRSFGAGCAVM